MVHICPHFFVAVLCRQCYHLPGRAVTKLQQISPVHIGKGLCSLPGCSCDFFNLFISNIGIILTPSFRGKGQITAFCSGVHDQLQHLLCPKGIGQAVLHIGRIAGLQIPAGFKIRIHIKAHRQGVIVLVQPNAVLFSHCSPQRGILRLFRINTILHGKQGIDERCTACDAVGVGRAFTAQLFKERRQIGIGRGRKQGN